MGRKKGGHNADTILKAQVIAEKVINEGKTMKAVAEELGINRNTVSHLMSHAMSDEEVKMRINRSRDRVTKMLSLADSAYLRILTHNEPTNFGNQAALAKSIYKTYGVIREDPAITINNIVPVKVEVDGQAYQFTPNHKEDE